MRLLLRLAMAVALVPTWGGGYPARAQGEAPTQDDTFKALFIYNFLQYVEWPDEDTSGVYVIRVLGDAGLTGPLEEIALKRTIGGRELVVERASGIDALDPCHVLFLTGALEEGLEGILEAAEPSHVLTVGDTEGFADRGVAINFTTVEGKLKFEINRRALERAGLEASSQLLKVAVRIVEAEAEER